MAKLRLVVLTLLLTTATTINGSRKASPKVHLPTPEEGCGRVPDLSNTRIVGGAPAKNGAWPWMALLFYRSNELSLVTWVTSLFFKDTEEISPSCGGSLITSKHVLTAAHCVWNDLVFVRLGEHDTRTTDDGPHEDVGIARTEIHKKYNGNIYINDIALIYLNRSVIFTDRISPICLPINTEAMLKRRFVGNNPFLAGWGFKKQSSIFWRMQMSPILMQVQVPVVSNVDCRKSYEKIDGVTLKSQFDDRVVCAGFTEGGKDSCQGDSGGPLMVPVPQKNGHFPFYQIGIVSWGTGCAQPNIPGVYTNVQFFAEWIKKKISM